MAKLGDLLIGKIHSLSQKLSSKDETKLKARAFEVKTYKNGCAEKATAMAKEVKKAVTPKVSPVREEVPTFNLEDILEEFRGR